MKTLYVDCFSGISGDMFLAGMLDAGLSEKYLSEQLELLNLPEFMGVKTRKVLKGAIMATLIDFELGEIENHHHTEHHDDHAESHDHEHSDGHNHEYEKYHETHHHARNFVEIVTMINESALKDSIKVTAINIFTKLAEAEAKVHGTSVEKVHFHEVGAADSILDIVGAAIALDYFGIDQVYASALPLGSGTVQTQHGLLPIPAPATMELLKISNASIVPSDSEKELVTPTGAAILAVLAQFKQPAMQLMNTGIGAGHSELPWPNILRVFIGVNDADQGIHAEIETNIDDMNPQFYASVMTHLFDHGALDVYFTPIQMKKNRPATKLSVICERKDEAALSQILLRETSTMGVRVKVVQRYEAEREVRKIDTRYGQVTIKTKQLNGKIVQANPEYEECLVLAERENLPVADIYQEVLSLAWGMLDSQI